MLTTLEPVAASWGYRHGRAGIVPVPPLPPELRERSERNYGYIAFLQYGLLCALVYFLMRKYKVPPAALGLWVYHWPSCFGVGIATGVAILATQRLTRALAGALAGRPVPYHPADHLTRGSARLWLLSNLVSCFGEEYWRAFCIVSLREIQYSTGFAVLATSVAFCVAHFRTRRQAAFQSGYLLKAGADRVIYALVFVWLRSVLATYTGHLLVNLVALYRARRALRNAAGCA